MGLLKWPLTLTGAILVFGMSTEGTLSLVASNAHRLTSPVTARTDVNVAPVKQLGTLNAPLVAVARPVNVASANAAPSLQLLATPSDVIRTAAEPESVSTAISTRRARIGDSAVNVRSAPSRNAAKLGVAAAGTPIDILGSQQGWIHIRFDAGEGWVYSDYIANLGDRKASTSVSAPAQPESVAKPSRRKAATVSGRMVVRVSPDSGAASLFRLEPGDKVHILKRDGKWMKVTTVSGDTGWIRAK